MYNNVPANCLRPLPPRPDLAYQETRAQELLRASHPAATPDAARESAALDAARESAALDAAPESAALDAARDSSAREYGSASWAKLVKYFHSWELHERAGPRLSRNGMAPHENRVAWLTTELRNRKAFEVQPPDIEGTAALLATYFADKPVVRKIHAMLNG